MRSRASGLSGIRTPLAAAVVLLALLVVLAILQYRWIGEISRADGDRMRAAARAAAESVASAFDREITLAAEHFALPETVPVEESGPVLAELSRRWSAASPESKIVSEVLVARQEAGGDFSLWRGEASTERMARVPWPAELLPVRARLATWLSGDPGPPGESRPGERRPGDRPPGDREGGRGFRRSFAAIVDEVPALVMLRRSQNHPPPPDSRGGAPFDRGERRGGPENSFRRESPPDRPASWIVVRLDRQAVLKLLAALTARGFGSAGALDAAVYRGKDARDVVYRTREGFPPRAFTPDAQVSLFAVRPPEPPGGHRGPGGGGDSPGRPPDFEHGPRGFGPGGSSRGVWTLVLRHPAGSLQAAVDAIRRRNLAVSGAILLLLVGALGILLLSARRAQRLAMQKIEFVAGITHELRTPLAAIRSAGQNLADGVVADPERVRQYGALLVREGRRLSGLIEQALSQAGIQARPEDAPRRRLSLIPVLEEAIAVCRSLAEEHRTVIDRDLPVGLPEVMGDASGLRTVFENLVWNAVKYGGSSGRVGVQARPGEGWVEISVSDRGPGIPARDLPRIFEPFYRGSEAAAGAVPGAGIGLSLVRRIVEAHGGAIRVETSEGSGTTFFVSLPAAAEDERGTTSERAAS